MLLFPHVSLMESLTIAVLCVASILDLTKSYSNLSFGYLVSPLLIIKKCFKHSLLMYFRLVYMIFTNCLLVLSLYICVFFWFIYCSLTHCVGGQRILSPHLLVEPKLLVTDSL